MGRIKRVVSIVILGLLCVAVFGFSQTTRRAQSNDSEYWEVGEWEIQDPIEEIWYLGTILPTDEGLYFLRICGTATSTAVFDFYPDNSTLGHSTFTVFYKGKFLIGGRLYQLKTTMADHAKVTFLGVPQ